MKQKKLKLDILRELEKGNKNISQNDFQLNEDEFVNISKLLEKEELITGLEYFHNPRVDYTEANLTLKGENYLSENSTIKKTYKVLKEIRDLFKL